MGVFRELLSIKAFRESKAEQAVRRQRQTLAEAQAREQERQQALERFRQYAIDQEQGLYADLCSRIVHLRDIEDVQQSVADLRVQAVRHEDSVREAARESEQESTRLKECKAALDAAARAKQKFVELAQVHADEQLQAAERKEDAELEEAAETRRDRADWDEYRQEEAA